MGKYRLFHLKSYQRSIGEDYDWILEHASFKFGLRVKTRKQDKIDRLHYLLLFWKKNKNKFLKYKTYESIGDFLGLDHSSIIHYVGDLKNKRLNRKKSNYWVQNVVDINEYILDAKLGKRLTQK
jgi:hypothetical protein